MARRYRVRSDHSRQQLSIDHANIQEVLDKIKS